MKQAYYYIGQSFLCLAVAILFAIGLQGEIDPHSAYFCGALCGIIFCTMLHIGIEAHRRKGE